MPQAAMLYARRGNSRSFLNTSLSFNAASGNAIRATNIEVHFSFQDTKFQCRKRQCYTRDMNSQTKKMMVLNVSMPQAAMLYARLQSSLGDEPVDPEFQCRKRQCYTRDSKCIFKRFIWAFRVSMPQAAMLYARHIQQVMLEAIPVGFNAASGNAIRATI